jgi:hypothetical protein
MSARQTSEGTNFEGVLLDIHRALLRAQRFNVQRSAFVQASKLHWAGAIQSTAHARPYSGYDVHYDPGPRHSATTSTDDEVTMRPQRPQRSDHDQRT